MYTSEVQSLFFEDQYHLMELKQGFQSAKDNGVAVSLEKIDEQMRHIDETGEKMKAFEEIREIF